VRFEKQLKNGEGDRREGVEKHKDLDILILEGWCVNLKPLKDFSYEQYQHMYEGL
jgi:pantothenate kinase-related protein Tda10